MLLLTAWMDGDPRCLSNFQRSNVVCAMLMDTSITAKSQLRSEVSDSKPVTD